MVTLRDDSTVTGLLGLCRDQEFECVKEVKSAVASQTEDDDRLKGLLRVLLLIDPREHIEYVVSQLEGTTRSIDDYEQLVKHSLDRESRAALQDIAANSRGARLLVSFGMLKYVSDDVETLRIVAQKLSLPDLSIEERIRLIGVAGVAGYFNNDDSLLKFLVPHASSESAGLQVVSLISIAMTPGRKAELELTTLLEDLDGLNPGFVQELRDARLRVSARDLPELNGFNQES